MPTIDRAPALPAAVVVILCASCDTDHYTAGPDRRFYCPCGSVLTTGDVVLDPDESWCVTPTGLLAYVTAPDVALTRYREARAVMEDLSMWRSEMAAHAEYRRALAELDTAIAMGLRLPEHAPVEIGRVYFAAVINPDGTYGGGNANALGWDCTICAPSAIDPSRQEAHPCRNPRGHATHTVNGWTRHADRRRTHTYQVVSPVAPDLPTARERAAAIVNRRRAAALPA
ncbi:hypothetical protein ACFWRZ_09050 [Streptomyces rubiginosohelvolus]|uniref:hypothetical protein n=1 Tax=Streptomyces rubiginosohelvolus TaxID=67362 RepID=UPI003660D4DD